MKSLAHYRSTSGHPAHLLARPKPLMRLRMSAFQFSIRASVGVSNMGHCICNGERILECKAKNDGKYPLVCSWQPDFFKVQEMHPELKVGYKPTDAPTENKRSAGDSSESPKPSVASADRIPVNRNGIIRGE